MKIGFYESDITPPLGEIMPGYYNERRAVTVHDRLYSKSMAIQSEEVTSIIIAVDTCFLPPEMHDIVTERIQKFTGITPDSVSIISTHTHLGAPISEYNVKNCPADIPYTDVFYRLVADSAILAYQHLDEAAFSFGKMNVEGLAFCRNYIMKNGTYVTNTIDYDNITGTLEDDIDDELTVLFAERDGKKIGALVSYPLHQDTVHPEVLGYSGDYGSVISQKLKQLYGPDFVCLFAIGTCGDVNHCDYTKRGADVADYYGHRKIGATLGEAAIEIAKNTVPVTGKLSQKKEKIFVKCRKVSHEELREKLNERFETEGHAMNIGNLVAYYMLEMPDGRDVYIHVIAIGDLAIYLLPGELYSTYGLRIKAESPFRYNFVIENANSYVGYIPSLKAFAPESRLYEVVPTDYSCVVPEAGTIITDAALSIANNIKS